MCLTRLSTNTKQLNSSIRDADWNEKKMGIGTKHGLGEYAQGIEIFSSYLGRENWNEDCIKERGKKLFEYAVNKVWNLNFE